MYNVSSLLQYEVNTRIFRGCRQGKEIQYLQDGLPPEYRPPGFFRRRNRKRGLFQELSIIMHKDSVTIIDDHICLKCNIINFDSPVFRKT